jgi:6-phosphogluconolactonase (cycloisomerase 2 family)
MAMDWPFPVCRNLARSQSMTQLRHAARRASNAALTAALGLALGACGGGGGGSSGGLSVGLRSGGNTATFAVGGQVSGLPSGEAVQLLNNGGDALTVSADGGFTFATQLAAGNAYDVTVGTQPAGASCSVSTGSGTVAGAVSNVAVTCSPALVKHIALFLDATTGTLLPYSYDLASGQLSALPAAPQGAAGTADAVLIDASATHAYTLGQNSAGTTQIWSYTIGAGGVLSANGLPLTLTASGLSIELDSSGRYLYALQQPASGTSAITTFAIDPTSGRLGLQSSYSAPSSATLASLWRNPAYPALYALDPGPPGSTAGTIATFSTDGTGNVNPTGVPTPTGTLPVAMAMTSDGKYAYVACLGPGKPLVWIYTVAADGTLRPANPSTLTLPAVALGSTPAPESIAIDPSNRHLYVGDTNQDVIYQFSIDPGTGALTALPTPTIASPVPPTLLSVVGDSTTRSWLYVAARVSADVATLSIDPATGQLAGMKPAAVGLLRGTAIVDDAFSP